ncbi:MAG: two-component regulator propeller domain-containing protein, partial [Pseudomonadota bacterium]
MSVDLHLSQPVFSQKLTQQTVTQTFQDSTGALWFVTQEGLNQYNGAELANFLAAGNDPSSLPTDIITRVIEDQLRNVWVSTLGGGVAKFNRVTRSFQTLHSDPNDRNTPYSNDVYSLFCDDRGIIWLGYENGFSSLDPETNRFHHFISDGQKLPFMGEVRSFSQGQDGSLWLATQNSGLLNIELVTGRVVHSNHLPGYDVPLTSGELYHVVADTQGDIWASSVKNGVFRINPSSGVVTNYRHSGDDSASLSSDHTFDVYNDSEGRIWVATDSGLDLFDRTTDGFVRYNNRNTDLSQDIVISVYQSREGMYWIGQRNGLSAGVRTVFKTYDQVHSGLSNNSINVFAETSDGSLWVGTDDGLNRLRPGSATFTWVNEATQPSLSSPIVMSLLGEGSILWVGTFDRGLNRLDLNNDTSESFRHRATDSQSLGSDGVTSILRHSSGMLLVGTYGGGLSLFDESNGSFKNFTTVIGNNSSISSNLVIALYEDSSGAVWVGTEDGLNEFDPITHSFKRFYAERNNPEALVSKIVWSLIEDSEGNLWVGTRGGGLYKWSKADRETRNPVFEKLSEEVQIPSSTVYGIQ